MPQNPIDDKSTLLHVLGLTPSSNRPLPGPVLNQIYVAIWRHQATLSLMLQHMFRMKFTYDILTVIIIRYAEIYDNSSHYIQTNKNWLYKTWYEQKDIIYRSVSSANIRKQMNLNHATPKYDEMVWWDVCRRNNQRPWNDDWQPANL